MVAEWIPIAVSAGVSFTTVVDVHWSLSWPYQSDIDVCSIESHRHECGCQFYDNSKVAPPAIALAIRVMAAVLNPIRFAVRQGMSFSTAVRLQLLSGTADVRVQL